MAAPIKKSFMTAIFKVDSFTHVFLYMTDILMFIRDQKGSEKPMEFNREHGSSGNPRPVSSPTADRDNELDEIDVAAFFRGRTEVALRLGDAVYRLKITRMGKLILNK